MGYKDNEIETKNTIDEEGFVHSGDIGEVDKDGFLTVKGRLKELLITAVILQLNIGRREYITNVH